MEKDNNLSTVQSAKKKQNRCSQHTKARGAKRTLVRLKAAKIKQDQESVALNSQGDSEGVYEDVMVYVKNQAVSTCKARGRPRKAISELIATPSYKRLAPLKVIYLPSPRERLVNSSPWGNQILPSRQHSQIFFGANNYPKTLLRPSSCQQTLLKSNNRSQTGLKPNVSPQSIFMQKTYPQSISGTNSFGKSVFELNLCPQTSVTVVETPANCIKHEEINGNNQQKTSYFPEDLTELLDNWDHLPEQKRELICWLEAPISFDRATLPKLVSNIHHHIAEWDDTEERKMQQVCEWLLENSHSKSFTVLPPKVVVESQPNNQLCGLWSSLEHASF